MAKQQPKTPALTLSEFKNIITQNNPTVIDTRLPDYFELGHISKSINYGFRGQYASLAKVLFNLDNEILLICKDGEENESINFMHSIGFTSIGGYLSGGIETWMDANEKYDMVISISAEELALDSKHNPKACVIDVREENEFNAGHVFIAKNYPISSIIKQHPNIEKNTELLVYCDKGFRSMIASSLLKVLGFTNIKNVWGGFEQIIHEKVEIRKGK